MRHRAKETRFFEIGIIVILCSSVFLFGAVQPVVFLAEESLILLLFILYMAARLIEGARLDKTPLFWPFMIFLSSIFIQVIPLPFSVLKIFSPHAVEIRKALGNTGGVETFSLIPARTFDQLTRWVTVFLFYLLVANVFTMKSIHRLLNSLFVLTCFEAFYGLFLVFTGNDCLLWYCKPEYRNYGSRLHGTYRCPNHMAGYLEMVIPLHAVQVLSKRLLSPFKSEEKAQKFLGIFFVTLFVITLFLTISRAGTVAFLIGMLYLYFSGKREEGGLRYTFYLKILVALVAIYLLWIGIGPIIDRFWQASSSLEQGRGVLWSDTLNLVKDFPVIGTGFGTYRFIFPKYKSILLGQAIYKYSHNDYLQFLAEGGIISLLAFLWLVFNALRMLVKENSLLARGAAAGFIAILVHSFFDFNLQIPANAWMFAVLMAIGWIARESGNDNHSHPSTHEHSHHSSHLRHSHHSRRSHHSHPQHSLPISSLGRFG